MRGCRELKGRPVRDKDDRLRAIGCPAIQGDASTASRLGIGKSRLSAHIEHLSPIDPGIGGCPRAFAIAIGLIQSTLGLPFLVGLDSARVRMCSTQNGPLRIAGIIDPNLDDLLKIDVA